MRNNLVDHFRDRNRKLGHALMDLFVEGGPPLVGVLIFYTVVSVVGITWGLPSRSIDRFLFSSGDVWSGRKIYTLSNAAEKLSAEALRTRGADVDMNANHRADSTPVPLTSSDQDAAQIYLRYRLYTYQPDEMITMMALSGMNPRRLQLDPRLYQYGGLFIYPVGALIAAAGVVGWADVRSDVVFYLDHPEEFGKFYVLARGYAAAWGALGVIVVFAIARRLSIAMTRQNWLRPRQSASATSIAENSSAEAASSSRSNKNARSVAFDPRKNAVNAGRFAAILFAMMPIVICMTHEAKPHIPGAVLMLLAVLFGMRCTNEARCSGEESDLRTIRRDFYVMCIFCGAALGMVLSSMPILVLIPLVALLSRSRGPDTTANDGLASSPPLPRGDKGGFVSRDATSPSPLLGKEGGKILPPPAIPSMLWRTLILRRVLLGFALAFVVYLLTNPYILINAITNRDVLRSNFGNSVAMYRMDRLGEGFLRGGQLMIEGARLPVLILGVIGLILAIIRNGRRHPEIFVLAVPAMLLFVQFVMLGAGKPAEYGRFSVFIDTALAIFAGCITAVRWHRARFVILKVIRIILLARVGMVGAAYLWAFHLDADGHGSRIKLAEELRRRQAQTNVPLRLAVAAEPAPYCCPPLDFAHTDLMLANDKEAQRKALEDPNRLFLRTIDTTTESAELVYPTRSWWVRCLWRPTPISWADKPYVIEGPTVRSSP